MQTWAIQDAKARFSEFLKACVENGPQLVTKRGMDAAVLVPIDVWQRLQQNAKPSLKSLLLSDTARGDFIIPERGKARRRAVQKVL